MKKLFLMMAAAITAVSVNAQVWMGGSLGFWSNSDAKDSEIKTTFNISPEVGYNLSEDWSIAMAFSYELAKYDNDMDITGLSVNPYVRYNMVKAGALSLFLDGGFEVGSYELNSGNEDKSYSAWGVGIKPGIAYSLNEEFSLVAHVGFLGYRDCDDEIADVVQRGFGFKFANTLTFGVYYSF